MPADTVPNAIDLPSEYYDEDDGTNTCLVCEAPNYRPLHSLDRFGFPFSFFRCSCGLSKQAPMPNEQFFEWFFNSDVFFSAKESGAAEVWGFYDYFRDESCRLRTSQRRFRIFSQLLGWGDGPRKIMKIGPSTGTLLHVAKQAGHDAIGCDVSDRFVKYAREHYDVRIDHGRFEKMPYDDSQFDAVFLFNVIENIPNVHEFLAAVRRTLNVGGHFILNHVEMRGNLIEKAQGSRYFIYRPPICYAFEDRTLAQIMARHGFRLKSKRRDVRYLHLEKITTLLRWRWAHRLARALGIWRIEFPIWAYPSWISVWERID